MIMFWLKKLTSEDLSQSVKMLALIPVEFWIRSQISSMDTSCHAKHPPVFFMVLLQHSETGLLGLS